MESRSSHGLKLVAATPCRPTDIGERLVFAQWLLRTCGTAAPPLLVVRRADHRSRWASRRGEVCATVAFESGRAGQVPSRRQTGARDCLWQDCRYHCYGSSLPRRR